MGSDRVRPPRDRDFVETTEGFFFCLVGELHPPDRYTAYLKYTPARRGRWARGDVVYRRELPYYHVRNVMATLEVLERDHPRYVWHDPVRSLRFSFVPRDGVARYYVPEERLRAIVAAPADPLERQAAELVAWLGRAAGVPAESLGITGSILLGLHDPAFSDIDLLVYGRDAALRIKDALARGPESPLAALEPERRARWRTETAERFGLSGGTIRDLEARRWNHRLFRGCYVSIHPTRRDVDIRERWGARRYRPIGPAQAEGTVDDATDALFLPAVYRLADVMFDDGRSTPALEVVSYEGLFCDVADRGDRVRASGLLEEVDGETVRIVVGTAGVAGGGWIIRVAPG